MKIVRMFLTRVLQAVAEIPVMMDPVTELAPTTVKPIRKKNLTGCLVSARGKQNPVC